MAGVPLNGWKLDWSIDETTLHIRPRCDHRWHVLDDGCHCRPDVAELADDHGQRIGWVAFHIALDGRGPAPGRDTQAAPGP